jgi:hypothetical protein
MTDLGDKEMDVDAMNHDTENMIPNLEKPIYNTPR